MGDRLCMTVFDDGLKVIAAPNMTQPDIDRARELGYLGSDSEAVWGMTKDHDYLHSVLAEAQGLRYSPVLRAVATKTELSKPDIWAEEGLVLEVQRRINEARTGGWR